MRRAFHTDCVDFPGPGDPSALESFPVWAVSVSNVRYPRVITMVKTGVLVGEKVEGIPALGRSSHNSLEVTSASSLGRHGNNDNLSVIDVAHAGALHHIFFEAPRGVQRI